MKKTTLFVLALASGSRLMAEPIDSQVIHNYSNVELGYGYLHDIGNSGINAHGVGGGGSCDINNVVVGVKGGYFRGDEDFGLGIDLDGWTISGAVGYVVRLMENRINVVPNFGINYAEVTASGPGGSVTADSTSISPGLTLSFAVNNRVSFHGGYAYTRDVDVDVDGHGFVAGTRIALTERIGLNLNAVFTEDNGFSGATSTLSFHF